MFVVGIVGGVASGKSKIASLFESLGAVVLDADRLGHEALKELEVQRAIRQRWGDKVFQTDGEVDRAALGRIVFATHPTGAAGLEQLESITHPRIGEKIDQRIAELDQEDVQVAVLDAPVLLKAGWDRRCDKLLFVDTPEAIRKSRAASRGWPEGEFERREAAQRPVEEKRSLADLILDNSGDLEHAQRQVLLLWNQITQST